MRRSNKNKKGDVLREDKIKDYTSVDLLYYNKSNDVQTNIEKEQIRKDTYSYLLFFLNEHMNRVSGNKDNKAEELLFSEEVSSKIGRINMQQLKLNYEKTFTEMNSDSKIKKFEYFEQNNILSNYSNFEANISYYSNTFHDCLKNHYEKLNNKEKITYKYIQDKSKYIQDKSKSINKEKIFGGFDRNSETLDKNEQILQDFCNFIGSAGFNLDKSFTQINQELDNYKRTNPPGWSQQDLENFKQFLNNNHQSHTITNHVEYPDYNVNTYNMPILGNRSQYTFTYRFRKYNYKLITSYDIDNIKYPSTAQDGSVIRDINFENMKDYILKQLEYINGLDEISKNIIKDYTRPYSYDLLKVYMVDPSPGFLDRYRTKKGITPQQTNRRLGNAFCNIIFNVLYIQDQATQERIKNKTFDEDADDVYNRITEEEWRRILQIYLCSLNEVILGAPSVKKYFTCFRGSRQDDYAVPLANQLVINNDFTTTPIHFYPSNLRPVSLSFNFEASEVFYNMQPSNNPTLYRVGVYPGCRLLFASPLTVDYLKQECEFFVPANHIVASFDLFTRKKDYNNRNNGDNICSNELYNGIYTKDVLLFPANPEMPPR